MKKLKGFKSFSSLENKRINNNHSNAVSGGISNSGTVTLIKSNFTDANGCPDYDTYVDGKYVNRIHTCFFD